MPTKILICVTPEENILGSNFLKNILTSLFIFILILKIGLKFFLTKKNKTINCKKPARETAYDKVKTSDIFNHCDKNKDKIKI